MPAVTAMAAFLGLRPVANALGCSCGMTYSRGMGSCARRARLATIAKSSGSSDSSSGCAPLMRSARRSENQYIAKLNATPMAEEQHHAADAAEQAADDDEQAR